MEEMKRNGAGRDYAFIGVLGVTVLAILILFSSMALAGVTDHNASPVEVYAYVANSNSNDISIIDTHTDTVISTVSVGRWPEGIAVNSAGTKVYVVNGGSNDVSVIDTTTSEVIATVPVGSYPSRVAVNPEGTKVYVVDRDNNVSVIDAITNTVIATISVGYRPTGVVVNPEGKKVYVASSRGSTSDFIGTIFIIDVMTNTVTATIPVGSYSNPSEIALNPAGTKIYVVNRGHPSVSVIDTATNSITATVDLGGYPWGIVVNPAGTKVYVAVDNTISVIDTETNTVTATVSVGIQPEGIAVTPDGRKVYTANYVSNSVSVIDTATNTVIATVLVGKNPISLGQFIGSVPVQLTYPDANFSTNVTSGYAPLSVQFTDLSQNATAWKWDFGDEATSTEQNPTHTYSTAGTYTVNLTASNSNGTDSRTATINVLKVTPTITWNTPADIIAGTALSNIQLNAVASVPGTFVYTPAEGTVLSIGTQTLHVGFTPIDTANYNTASKDVTINVLTPAQKIEQMISMVQNLNLNPGQSNNLIVKLDAAVKSLNLGKTNESINKLNSFINEVKGYTNSGVLSQAEGQALIDEANSVINALSPK